MIKLKTPKHRSYRAIQFSSIHRIAKYQIESHVHAYHMDDAGNVTYYTKVR
jgi:hypothetical protein